MNPTTPHRLVYIVVCTAASMAATFIIVMAVLLFVKAPEAIDDKIFAAFVTAGSNAMSYLFGVLTNTRTQSTPVAESSQVVTTTSTTPPPTPPDTQP
jgi:hypothetical protein